MQQLLFYIIVLFPSFHLISEEVAWKEWNKRVYLATYQRSGNHWMRYLIEEATGLATSSVWQDRDPEHLPIHFPWGGFCCDHGYEGTCSYPIQEDAVIIKTHFPSQEQRLFDLMPYLLTIRIIRHPLDSFFSRYTYGQTRGYIKGDLCGHKNIPRKLLLRYVEDWKRFQEYWNVQENVLTIRYEDLLEDPSSYLQLILDSIGYSISQTDIQRAVDRYPPIGNALKHLEHFTQEDLAFVEPHLRSLLPLYDYEITKVNTTTGVSSQKKYITVSMDQNRTTSCDSGNYNAICE